MSKTRWWLLSVFLTSFGLLWLWLTNERSLTDRSIVLDAFRSIRAPGDPKTQAERLRQWVTPFPRTVISDLQDITDGNKAGSNHWCRERPSGDIRLSPVELAFTGLVGPWRAGNTWVRHLLQQATGFCTTGLYCDKELRDHGFPFECAHEVDRKRCLLVKAHLPDPAFERTYVDRLPEVIPEFDRAVLLVRNPYEFIVANMYFWHMETVPEEAFMKNNSRWRHSQPKLLDWWRDMNAYWLTNYTGALLPVLYSRIRRDVYGELHHLLAFLHVNVSDADVRCAVQCGEGSFHRPSRKWTRVRSLVELFDRPLQAKINLSIAETSKQLRDKFGIIWMGDNDDLFTNTSTSLH
ncbi:WCSD-like protein [Mya arenaria]|uniref:WCSD-like protein n=1 Tax=Mya arenaria TaxID=6604 RepID=A0ABY7FUZ9_MYAAR|nr:WSCD family member CG9164-like [Mya arenaria]WAR25457.1 WCSD-like protein [Mya arenaria]